LFPSYPSLLTGQDEQVVHLRLPIPSLIPNAETGYQVEDGDIFIFPSRNLALLPSVRNDDHFNMSNRFSVNVLEKGELECMFLIRLTRVRRNDQLDILFGPALIAHLIGIPCHS